MGGGGISPLWALLHSAPSPFDFASGGSSSADVDADVEATSAAQGSRNVRGGGAVLRAVRCDRSCMGGSGHLEIAASHRPLLTT